MVSKSKKFIFIHIPKTGGNSIQSILKKYSEDEIVAIASHQDGKERFAIKNREKHSTLADYKKELSTEEYKSMFKFAVVRNPWDRMISYYFSPHQGTREFNRREFKKLIKNTPILAYYTTEISFVDRAKNKFGLFNHSQNPLRSNIDFYLRFENLEEDFQVLCDKIEIPYSSLPKYNKSKKKHYSYYYDEELKNLVANKFRQEINFFNYKFKEESFNN